MARVTVVSSDVKRKIHDSENYFDLELFKTIRKIVMGKGYLIKSELDQIGEAIDKSAKVLDPVDRETNNVHKWLAAMESPVAVGNFEIRVEGRIFHVERNILAANSPVFAACFEQKTLRESQEKYYLIENFSAEVVEQFLLYCYTGTAPRLNEISADIASMAHQYQVQDLLDKCEIFMIQDAIRYHRKNDMTGLLELAQMAEDFPLRILLVAFHCIIGERFKWEAIREQEIWVQFFEKRPAFNSERYKAVYSLSQDFISSSEFTNLGSPNVLAKKIHLIPPRRAVSAYRLFVNEEQPKLRDAKVPMHSEEMKHEISQRWVNADLTTRCRYEKLATDDKKRFLSEKKNYDAELKKLYDCKPSAAKRAKRSRSPHGDADYSD